MNLKFKIVISLVVLFVALPSNAQQDPQYTDYMFNPLTVNSAYAGYSKPRNLGSKVNTAGREMFPYITDTSIYFSSDGHLGLGALDVFESKIIDNSFTKPLNLGAPLNSELDDFGFIVKEEVNKGFVCSINSRGWYFDHYCFGGYYCSTIQSFFTRSFGE